MKDFFKIFFVLILIAAAFLYGKNYGESAFKNSEEYQKLIDEKNFEEKTNQQTTSQESTIVKSEKTEIRELSHQKKLVDSGHIKENIEEKIEEQSILPSKEIPFSIEKYKTFEWLLINAETKEAALRSLDKLKLKSLDAFLKNAQVATSADYEDFVGSYRGNIIGETGAAFGSLVINLKKNVVDNQELISGEILVYRNGKEIIGNRFDSASKGLRVVDSSSLILDSQKNYYQLYKLKNTGQIAGYFYERLVNGSTKIIGVFALNRVDQF